MKIQSIPAFSDNYIWWIELEKGRILIDPGASEPVLQAIEGQEKKQTIILLTHCHQDHIGGVKALKAKLPGILCYGPSETDNLNDVNVKGGEEICLFGEKIDVLASPGHTEAGVSYRIENALFPGDALFKAGCGRVFTGDYRAQYDTLKIFKDLDDEVEVYPGHEYSLDNLVFAKHLFPENLAIDEELEVTKDLRENGENTLPTTIGLERKINPFFLARNFQEFKEFRKEKDSF